MILVDTSIWIDHLRASDEQLVTLLNAGKVLAHPFVIGELALGNLVNRQAVLGALQELPQTKVATSIEVLQFINEKTLCGSGVGYTDAHLLAAVLLTPGSTLWTRDKRLRALASRLAVAAPTTH